MTRSSGRSRHVFESLEESPKPQKKSKSKERSVSASPEPRKKSKSKSRERSLSESPKLRKESKSRRDRYSAPVPQNYSSRYSSPVPQKFSNRRHSAPESHKIYVIESSPESSELRKSSKEKIETIVSPSLRNHKRSPKERGNEVVIDAVLRNYQIILVIVAVILSCQFHKTKNSSWI